MSEGVDSDRALTDDDRRAGGSRLFPRDFVLLLASGSPRRRDLLAAAGIPFHVVPTGADESDEAASPEALAEANAAAKARAAIRVDPPTGPVFVLGADTVVWIDGCSLGKPAHETEARSMLAALSGRAHEVVTGVALRRLPGGAEPGPGEPREYVASARTTVRFRPLSAAEIDAYVACREWEGKAGGYAIQGIGSLLVEGIEGDYSNVVGLPMTVVADLFVDAGFDLLRGAWLR